MKSLFYIFFTLMSALVWAQTPPDISLVFYVAEQSSNGTLVGTVSATDPDGDLLTFSIVSGNEANAFAIGSTSGEITVSDGTLLDFETTPTFSLMVEADDGNGGMTTAGVTINLTDVLGVADVENIKVWPSPISDYIQLSFSEEGKQVSVEIHSLNGSKMTFDLTYETPSQISVDVRHFTSGVYILSAYKDQHLMSKERIIIK